MKKKVWIINHYAGRMFEDKGGRHYWIAKFLKEQGYNPIVICSNTKHNSNKERYIDNNASYNVREAEEIKVPFVYIKARPYCDNGKDRIINMVGFYFNLLRNAECIKRRFGLPDIILSSSVHPLALVAGIKIARKYGVRCICEVRDLWPETLVAYGIIKSNSILARRMYHGEKWIYKNADRIIMTWPGGYEYILDKGWGEDIPAEKVVHISNGIDLSDYENNIRLHPYENALFQNYKGKRIVYAGSIRKVNKVEILISAFEKLEKEGKKNIELFIFGDGDERAKLEEYIKERRINNVCFMGRIPKNEIPSLLSQSFINILHNESTSLDKYGQSQNKFFEYLAAGRPILMTYSVGYSIVKEQECGIELKNQTPDSIADAVQSLCLMNESKLEMMGMNAKNCAKKYDFRFLTNSVVNIIEN